VVYYTLNIVYSNKNFWKTAFFFLEISGPKVVEIFVVSGGPGPNWGPAMRLQG